MDTSLRVVLYVLNAARVLADLPLKNPDPLQVGLSIMRCSGLGVSSCTDKDLEDCLKFAKQQRKECDKNAEEHLKWDPVPYKIRLPLRSDRPKPIRWDKKPTPCTPIELPWRD